MMFNENIFTCKRKWLGVHRGPFRGSVKSQRKRRRRAPGGGEENRASGKVRRSALSMQQTDAT